MPRIYHLKIDFRYVDEIEKKEDIVEALKIIDEHLTILGETITQLCALNREYRAAEALK